MRERKKRPREGWREAKREMKMYLNNLAEYYLLCVFDHCILCKIITHCCCCCLHSETGGRNKVTQIFRYFFIELPVPPQAAGVRGTF